MMGKKIALRRLSQSSGCSSLSEASVLSPFRGEGAAFSDEGISEAERRSVGYYSPSPPEPENVLSPESMPGPPSPFALPAAPPSPASLPAAEAPRSPSPDALTVVPRSPSPIALTVVPRSPSPDALTVVPRSPSPVQLPVAPPSPVQPPAVPRFTSPVQLPVAPPSPVQLPVAPPSPVQLPAAPPSPVLLSEAPPSPLPAAPPSPVPLADPEAPPSPAAPQTPPPSPPPTPPLPSPPPSPPPPPPPAQQEEMVEPTPSTSAQAMARAEADHYETLLEKYLNIRENFRSIEDSNQINFDELAEVISLSGKYSEMNTSALLLDLALMVYDGQVTSCLKSVKTFVFDLNTQSRLSESLKAPADAGQQQVAEGSRRSRDRDDDAMSTSSGSSVGGARERHNRRVLRPRRSFRTLLDNSQLSVSFTGATPDIVHRRKVASSSFDGLAKETILDSDFDIHAFYGSELATQTAEERWPASNVMRKMLKCSKVSDSMEPPVIPAFSTFYDYEDPVEGDLIFVHDWRTPAPQVALGMAQADLDPGPSLGADQDQGQSPIPPDDSGVGPASASALLNLNSIDLLAPTGADPMMDDIHDDPANDVENQNQGVPAAKTRQRATIEMPVLLPEGQGQLPDPDPGDSETENLMPMPQLQPQVDPVTGLPFEKTGRKRARPPLEPLIGAPDANQQPGEVGVGLEAGVELGEEQLPEQEAKRGRFEDSGIGSSQLSLATVGSQSLDNIRDLNSTRDLFSADASMVLDDEGQVPHAEGDLGDLELTRAASPTWSISSDHFRSPSPVNDAEEDSVAISARVRLKRIDLKSLIEKFDEVIELEMIENERAELQFEELMDLAEVTIAGPGDPDVVNGVTVQISFLALLHVAHLKQLILEESADKIFTITKYVRREESTD